MQLALQSLVTGSAKNPFLHVSTHFLAWLSPKKLPVQLLLQVLSV